MRVSHQPARPKLVEQVKVALGSEEKQRIFEAAAQQGVTASEFIRRAINKAVDASQPASPPKEKAPRDFKREYQRRLESGEKRDYKAERSRLKRNRDEHIQQAIREAVETALSAKGHPEQQTDVVNAKFRALMNDLARFHRDAR